MFFLTSLIAGYLYLSFIRFIINTTAKANDTTDILQTFR